MQTECLENPVQSSEHDSVTWSVLPAAQTLVPPASPLAARKIRALKSALDLLVQMAQEVSDQIKGPSHKNLHVNGHVCEDGHRIEGLRSERIEGKFQYVRFRIHHGE